MAADPENSDEIANPPKKLRWWEFLMGLLFGDAGD